MNGKSGWTLIESQDDWEIYRQGVASHLGMPISKLKWGPPPAVVQCLAASVSPDGASVLSSYVFPADASRLLQSCQVPQEEEPKPETSLGNGVSPAQADHNKAMAAHVLAVVQLLVDTGIVDKEKYEKRFTAQLAHVDQEAAAALTELIESRSSQDAD
jgi:hypothetical protein